MKLKREFSNGFLIFLGIGVYFLLMDLLGLSDVYFLRLLNVVFVLWGVSKTINANVHDGKTDYLQNFISGMITSQFGVFLSVVALRLFISIRGEAFVRRLSHMLWFGPNASGNDYCIGLLFEGAASCIIVSFIVMQFYNSKFAAD